MQYENPYALHLSKLAAIRKARDAETLRIVLGAGLAGITSYAIREITSMSADQCKNSLLRLRDEGFIECGTGEGHEWLWGAVGIRKRLSEQAKERRRIKRTAAPDGYSRSNAARRMKREQMQREDEAASDAWARESIRRIVPATDAEPIRPERPMSIFEMGAA